MNLRDLEKLLGGYAAGTLTDAEQQALCDAALHDQVLFEALLREQPLRDLLSDPAARERLLAAVDPPPRRAWRWRPVAAVLAMAAIGVIAAPIARRPRPVLTSQAVPPPVPAASVNPQPAPAPPVVAQGLRNAGHGPAPQKLPPALARARLMPRPAPPFPPRAARAAPGTTAASLQGVVRDAAGAAIPDATVVAVNKFTAESAQASTNPAGRYEFSKLRPGIYSLSAQAQGFSPAAVKELPVKAQAAHDLTLQAGSASETVEVSAQAASISTAALKAPAATLRLRYAVLRRDAAGNFVEAAPADLRPGDTVELRITAEQDGYLSVGGAPPVALTAYAPYTTPPLPASSSEWRVTFSVQPLGGVGGGGIGGVPAGGLPSLTGVQGRETYVAAREPGQPLNFTVKLP